MLCGFVVQDTPMTSSLVCDFESQLEVKWMVNGQSLIYVQEKKRERFASDWWLPVSFTLLQANVILSPQFVEVRAVLGSNRRVFVKPLFSKLSGLIMMTAKKSMLVGLFRDTHRLERLNLIMFTCSFSILFTTGRRSWSLFDLEPIHGKQHRIKRHPKYWTNIQHLTKWSVMTHTAYKTFWWIYTFMSV